MEDLSPTPNQTAIMEMAGRLAKACAGQSFDVVHGLLINSGVLAALVTDKQGGLGLALRDTLPIITQFARSNLSYPLAEAMIAAVLASSINQRAFDNLVNGTGTMTMAWASSVVTRKSGDGWVLNGTAYKVRAAALVDAVIMPVLGERDVGLALVPVKLSGIQQIVDRYLSHEAGDIDMVLSDVPIGVDSVLMDANNLWQRADAMGGVLQAADMYGVALAAHEAAKSYTSQRRQFGKPLTAKQSVRHILARDHFNLETVRYCLEYAAEQIDRRAPDAEMARDILKGTASEKCIAITENAIQLHGAMGVTFDMPLHHYLRRVMMLSDTRPTQAARARVASHLFHKWKVAS